MFCYGDGCDGERCICVVMERKEDGMLLEFGYCLNCWLYEREKMSLWFRLVDVNVIWEVVRKEMN